ncbi:manganese efflux pump [Paenibacillus sp. GP183]|uniref:manganese efflux pump MntP n=1 Tax=Paenibacillus sp. GP183 TaxID=1882751 RepID=UPI0008999F24|nr:manganese efflux pump [Paenibacillus sp. GP183]SEB45602.1 Putative Mn2+ efflux pump MntP [Paenibacillus sp. GP183]
MPTLLKMLVLVLSLGIDTLLISTSLGVIKTKGKLKIAVVFACAETIMPLIGLFIGKGAGQLVGNWASLIGGLLLIGVSIWLIFFEDEEEEEKLERNLIGWTLIMTALSISLDELAVGFSIGLVGVPVALTIFLIALQAFFFTFLGLTFGSKFKPYMDEWSEKIAGLVLGLLGLWIIIESLLKL